MASHGKKVSKGAKRSSGGAVGRMLSRVWKKRPATRRAPTTPGPSPRGAGTPRGLMRPVSPREARVVDGAKRPAMPVGFDDAAKRSPRSPASSASSPASPEMAAFFARPPALAPPPYPARSGRPASPEMALWDAIDLPSRSPVSRRPAASPVTAVVPAQLGPCAAPLCALDASALARPTLAAARAALAASYGAAVAEGPVYAVARADGALVELRDDRDVARALGAAAKIAGLPRAETEPRLSPDFSREVAVPDPHLVIEGLASLAALEAALPGGFAGPVEADSPVKRKLLAKIRRARDRVAAFQAR